MLTSGIRLVGFPTPSRWNEAGETLLMTAATNVSLTSSKLVSDVTLLTLTDFMVQHTYKNHTSQPLSAFVLISKTMPKDYSLLNIQIEVNDKKKPHYKEPKTIYTRITRLETAEANYEQFVKSNCRGAKRIESNSNYHMLDAGCVMESDSKITVRSCYTTELKQLQSEHYYEFGLTIPSTFLFAESVLNNSGLDPTMISIAVEVKTQKGFRVSNIYSPSLEICEGITLKSESTPSSLIWSSTFSTTSKTENLDFEFGFRLENTSESLIVCAKEKSKNCKASGGVMVNILPAKSLSETCQPCQSYTEIIFVVGFSGRYNLIVNENLAALLFCIQPNCLFNVIRVDSNGVSLAFELSQIASEENILKVINDSDVRYCENVPDFTFNLTLDALKTSFNSPMADVHRHRRVILITDEDTDGFPLKTFEELCNQHRPPNCFLSTVAVGKPSGILEHMAKFAHGSTAYVDFVSDISRRKMINLANEASLSFSDYKEISVTWMDSQGNKMPVNSNGNGEGFVQIPARVTHTKVGEALQIFALAENSNMLPASVEIIITSPEQEPEILKSKMKHATPVFTKCIQTLGISKLLNEEQDCAHRREIALRLSEKIGMLTETSTILPLVVRGSKKRSSWESCILPAWNLLEFPAITFISHYETEMDIKRPRLQLEAPENSTEIVPHSSLTLD